MHARASRRSFTFREYLELEETSNTKHEFFAGEIYAMAGGTPAHAALSMAIGAELVAGLRSSPCRVFSSDLRVRVAETGLTTYPDVTVVCDELETDPESNVTVTNPSVVVEVLSPSTEEYDRGEKLEHYQRVPTLDACVLVSQTQREVTMFARKPEGGWSTQVLGPGGSFAVGSTGVTLDVDALYDSAGVATR